MNKNNKLIAEFMGKTDLITENQFLSMEHKAHNPTIIEYLKYDTDWNGLMEVIEKIESLNYSLEINKQEELNYQCLITQKNNIIIQKFNLIKIEAVYQAVVEFINYYKTL